MTRPKLSPTTPAADFLGFYWLKQELLDFCRAEGLSTAGSKQELTQRIAQFLEGSVVAASQQRRAAKAMPAQLERSTVITAGFRCSQELRAFFVSELGPQFHFDRTMREFIKTGAGHTLGEAIEVWQAAQANPTEHEIEPQFEYNRHMREFFKANPDATRPQAISAWREKRAQRREV